MEDLLRQDSMVKKPSVSRVPLINRQFDVSLRFLFEMGITCDVGFKDFIQSADLDDIVGGIFAQEGR